MQIKKEGILSQLIAMKTGVSELTQLFKTFKR